MRGAVMDMNQSFKDFGFGLIISVLLVYLILMAQFASFIDPFIILMAIPPGIAGVVLTLVVTGSTLNIMSLMGIIMMTGIVVSNSILIVEFSNILHEQGRPLLEATVEACKVRLRPIIMTSRRDVAGHDSDGSGCGGRQRAICPAGPGGDRWSGRVAGGDGVPGSRGVPSDSYAARAQRGSQTADCAGGTGMRYGGLLSTLLLLSLLGTQCAVGGATAQRARAQAGPL